MHLRFYACMDPGSRARRALPSSVPAFVRPEGLVAFASDQLLRFPYSSSATATLVGSDHAKKLATMSKSRSSSKPSAAEGGGGGGALAATSADTTSWSSLCPRHSASSNGG